MTTTIIITICSLLLLAYVFDITSPFTKIPSVILLLLLGWGVRQATDFFTIQVPGLDELLPALGTIGLIMIVLEGSLDIQLSRSKNLVIRKSILFAVLPMLALAFLLAFVFQHFGQTTYRIGLLNAIPFCVISSAIAIPSVSNLSGFNKEFIIYESSLSDIFGILFFNFIALNEFINAFAFIDFTLQLVIIIIVSLVSMLGLSFLLSRIKHHISYAPIILLIFLIYFISKVFHLPGLIFIMVFGLFLGNLDKFSRFKGFEKLRPEKLGREVKKFKDINTEATFLIRALFFLLFGFMMKGTEILNLSTLPWAVAIVTTILIVRWVILRLAKLPTSPLLYIAPRGLITILLFLTLLPEQSIPMVNKSLIIQTIILSALVMMFGLMNDRADYSIKADITEDQKEGPTLNGKKVDASDNQK